jgi:uncharacterized membrane protein
VRPDRLKREVFVTESVVVAFDNETGAAGMRDAVIELQKQKLVALDPPGQV